MANNKLSFLVQTLVPAHIKESNDGFTTFIASYFEYLEREFGEYDAVANLLSYRDIDETVDSFLDEFVSTYAYPLSPNTASNLKNIIKQIRKYYQTKGSEDAYKYLFQAMYNSSLEFYFPSDDLLKTSTRGRNLSELNSHIVDSNYWQDFSYVLRTGVPANVYEKLLYALGHPAGLKLFGEFKPTPPEMDMDLNLTESLLFIILIDELIGINGLNFSLPQTEAEQSLIFQRIQSGVRPTTSTFTKKLETTELPIQQTESQIISLVDGQSSEQQMLLFYNRDKQDVDSFRVEEDTNLRLLSNTEIASELYQWDVFKNITSGDATVIGFNAATTPDTITSEDTLALDFTDFFSGSVGEYIKVVTTSGVNDGVYKISAVAAGAIEITNPDDSAATLTTEAASAAGESRVYTVDRTVWYETTLRDQPVLASQDMFVVRLPQCDYAANTNTIFTNTFEVFSSITSSASGLFFYNGKKLITNDLSVGAPDGDGISRVTVTGQTIPPASPIEYYSCDFDLDSWTLAATGNTFTLNQTPNNIIVFINGDFVYPGEYTISGGNITIPDSLVTTLSASGTDLEVIYLQTDYFGKKRYLTSAGQELFELPRPIEKVRFANPSQSIQILNGSAPDPQTAPTPTAANNFNIIGTVEALGYVAPVVPSGATVFSVDLFTGDNSARTVVNGLDMATNGGALITYNRDNGRDGFMDSARGVGNPDYLALFSATTSQQTLNINGITSFNSDGWTLPPNIYTNSNLADFSTYSFMRDSRFFDCLTYAGNGVSGRDIAHSLDVAPGMIFIKAYDYDIGVPIVWHKDLAGSNDGIPLWTAEDPITTNDYWANTAPTDSVFTVGNRRDVNDASYNFVAWIFAHDPANFSYCGSYTGNGSTQSINLGWQPQFLLVKNITPSNTQRWLFFDDQRGATTGNDFVGQNVQNAEITGVDYIDFTSTGFDINTSVAGMNASSNSYIFYAVRE